MNTQGSLSTFTLDGFVAGTWRVDRVRRDAAAVISPLRAVSKAERSALSEEAVGLLAFLAPDSATHDVRFAGSRGT